LPESGASWNKGEAVIMHASFSFSNALTANPKTALTTEMKQK